CLIEIKIASNKTDTTTPPRDYVQIAQLKIPNDPAPTPRAMRNLLEHAKDFADLDVYLETKHLYTDSESILNYKFIYMHDKKSFAIDADDLKQLRFNL